MNRSDRTEQLYSVAVVACAVLYRPLTFWANNAWDLLAPQGIFITVGLEFVVALLLLILVFKLPVRPFPYAVTLAWTLLVVFNWDSLSLVGFIALSAATLMLVATCVWDRLSPSRATTVILAFGLLGPVIALVNAHLSSTETYPLRTPADPPSLANRADSDGDILLLVLDEYPMAQVARSWFGHDLAPLMHVLRDKGFETPRVSWSHNTYTSVAIPSMLELIQVVEPQSVSEWDHLKENYERIRGSSFTVKALRSAGFQYVHVESGWNGDDCGAPDDCLPTSWINEANWLLLEPSAFHPLIEDTLGSWMAGASMTTMEHLLATDVFENESNEFIYAHLLLPHTPEVVDADCEVLPAEERLATPTGIPMQLSCVDALIEDVVQRIPENTTVIITGDHGTATRGQHTQDPVDWDDGDIAERLGAFLAYRIPEECPDPSLPTNVSVMRSAVGCITGAPLPTESQGFVLGLKNPVEISSDHLAGIADQLLDGRLTVDS